MIFKRLFAAFAAIFIALLLVCVSTTQVSAAVQRLGGMNLNGYCGSLGQGSATLNNNTWACSGGTAITMTNACVWQYPNRNAFARQDTAGNPYSWTCYYDDAVTTTATPTPTRTVAATPTPTRAVTATPTPTQVVTPTPTAMPAPANSFLLIFDDALSSDWIDRSYNTTVTTVTTPVSQGTRAIAATINADGGFNLQSRNGQSTASYTTVHFALRSSQANQQYEVYADTTYGQPLRAPVSLSQYGGQPTTTGWTVYNIPLSALGATNVTLRDIVIHDAVSRNQGVVYVDEVRLLGATTTTTPTPTPTVAPTTAPTNTPTPTPTTTANTYLALGDSFAFGFHLAQFQQQQATNSYNPASYNDGYDAVYYNAIRTRNVVTQEINYACPGESTTTFINGGCSNHTTALPLHNNYPVSQSQLQAAVAYLQANPNRVATITIDIGVNDAIVLSNFCEAQANPVQCYNDRTQGVLNTTRQNYATILNALQQAAPQARIILVKAPNPVYYDGSDALVDGINQIIDDAAATRGLRLADTYTLFTADTVCSLTNFCSNPSDFHPNAQGYNAMANRVLTASGY